MTPVVFDGCAGWLDIGSSPTGVVICAPFGQEAMLTYRGCRILAERLHAHGFSVLRFDYPGTGDSSGSEMDPDRVAAWQAGVDAAVAMLLRTTPAEHVILVGLRLGAALALRAAVSAPQVVGVGCLAPVVSGKSYARELRLLANTWREANLLPPAAQAVAHLDVVGDRLSGEALEALSAIDLRKLPATAPDILLVDDGNTPSIAGLAERLETLGARVVCEDFPDARAFLQDAFSTVVPEQAFASLIAWCRSLPLPAPRAEPKPAPSSVAPGILNLPGACEEAMRFGKDRRLYGVVCKPPGEDAVGSPVVVMVNTGFGRRTGDGRIYVTLARKLAAEGVATLRFDAAGFGESGACPGRSLDPYDRGIVDDLTAAADALKDRGYGALIVVGICSGAYAAFHAGLRDRRIGGLVIVNLQKFVWRDGASLQVENRRHRRPSIFYLRAIARRETWRRIFRGDAHIGSIGATLILRSLESAFNKACLLLERMTGLQTRAGQVRRWLAALERAGTRLYLVYSDGDPGLSELALLALSRTVVSRRSGLPRVQVIPEADHALLDHAARQNLIERICLIVADVQKSDPNRH